MSNGFIPYVVSKLPYKKNLRGGEVSFGLYSNNMFTSLVPPSPK